MMRIFLSILMILCFSSCQDSGGGEASSGSSGGNSENKEAGTDFNISIDSHEDETIYVYDSVYFDPIFGKFKGLQPAGTITVKWEVIIDGVAKNFGYGGVSSGKWVDGEYQASWAILNVKLFNKRYNKVKITITDSLGGSIQTSMTIFCDIKIPTIELTTPATNPVWVRNDKFELAGTLETEVNIDSFLIENVTNGSKTQMSVNKNWSGVINLDSGANNIVVKATDIVGGIGTYDTVIGSDLIAPSIAFSSPSNSNEFVTGSMSSASISGTAADDLSGLAIIKWENESTGDNGVASGLESWSISNINVLDGVNPIKITGVDNVGVEKIEYFNYVVDRTPPEFVTSSFNVVGNLKVTYVRDIELNFSISDIYSKINKFCVRYNLTNTPATGDPCWNDISVPAKNVNIVKFPFKLGDTSMVYKVYVWAMDEVGNISALENLGSGIKGKDFIEIQYQNFGVSPEVSNFLSVNSDSPNLPPKTSDTQASTGSDLYIKWKIDDDKVIPAGSITIDYTLDDKNYTNIISGISNSASSGCSIDANYTGCYKWTGGIPSDDYMKLRITVSDSDANVTSASSNIFNSGSLNILTGNTDLGLNGSANGSIIFNWGEDKYNDAGDPGALVVADNGFIFIRDHRRGLVYIDPSDGIIRQIAKQTGSYSGDGGSVFNATFKDLSYLTMDHEGNLLIWDASRIRKVDLSKSPWTIDRFIGGGSNTSDGAIAVDASIDYKSNSVLILVPTPSGKIYFSKGYKQIWYYDPYAKTVHKEIEFHGLGTDNLSGNKAIYDNSLCNLTHPGIQYDVDTSELVAALALARRSSQTYCGEGSNSSGWSTNFDVTTGEASPPHVSSGDDNWSAYKYTGMDGRLYLLEHGRDRLMIYNPGTRTYENLAGKVGAPGRCPDGTDKDECNMKLMSLFVNKNGTIYFIDMGVIRYIDSEDKVQTIAGQPRNHGVGLEAQDARYAQLEFFQKVGDTLYIKDSLEQQITAVPLNGGTIEHVAGNSVKSNPSAGSDSRTSPINNCRWALSCGFFIEEASNRLYHVSGGKVFYLDLDTYTWGDTTVPAKNQASMLGGDQNGKIIYYDNEHYGSGGDKTRIFVLDTDLNTRTKIYGSDIAAKNYSKLICDDGSDGTDCFIGYTHNNSVQTQYKFDSDTNSWIFFKRNTNTIHLIPRDGGVVTKLTDLASNAYSIASRREGSDHIIYYCASNGSLYKKNLTTSAESEINTGVTSMKCAGNSLHYSSDRDSLMFIFNQNYLYGIAEITAPGI